MKLPFEIEEICLIFCFLSVFFILCCQTKDDRTAIEIAVHYGADEAVMNALFHGTGKGVV